MAHPVVEIDGVVRPARLVGVNTGMNFGRFDSRNISVHSYSCEIPHSAAIAALEPHYQELVDELRSDDVHERSLLFEIGYPSLEKVLASFPRQTGEVLEHLGRTLLGEVLPLNTGTAYVINSIEAYENHSSSLSLSGRCFRYVDAPSGVKAE